MDTAAIVGKSGNRLPNHRSSTARRNALALHIFPDKCVISIFVFLIHSMRFFMANRWHDSWAANGEPAGDRPAHVPSAGGFRWKNRFRKATDPTSPRCGSDARKPQELFEEASRGNEPEPPICKPSRCHTPSLAPAPRTAC